MLIQEAVYQDEVVRATDLNRGSGEVLNKASRGPVTIIRNEESFALMRRETAANWKKEAGYAVHVTEIIWNALTFPGSLGPELEWISAFDEKERQQLGSELMQAFRNAIRDGSWEELDAVIHEWSESGWAALNPAVKAAFEAPSDALMLDVQDAAPPLA